MIFDLENNEIKQYLSLAEYGLEREGLRVNLDGTLAMTKHPFGTDHNIDRDFCENQTEIITDVFTDVNSLLTQLDEIQSRIYHVLNEMGEVFWCFSNPPKIGREEDIPTALFEKSMKHKNEYRHYLADKYGKKKMLFSGIHFNFSFSDELINTAFKMSTSQNLPSFKSELYLKLSKRVVQYSWLIVFLTAASPVTDSTFGVPNNQYSSVRCGREGYWNLFTPILDYTSFNNYIKSIEEYIQKGLLNSVSELYYPVRLKPRGNNSLEALKNNGVNHIELRMFDVNPLSKTGIFKEDLLFIHILLIYLASLPDFDFDENMQKKAIENIKSAALFKNTEIKENARKELKKILDFTEIYFPEQREFLQYQINKLDSGKSYAEIISRNYSEDYIKKGIALAEKYAGRENSV